MSRECQGEWQSREDGGMWKKTARVRESFVEMSILMAKRSLQGSVEKIGRV